MSTLGNCTLKEKNYLSSLKIKLFKFVITNSCLLFHKHIENVNQLFHIIGQINYSHIDLAKLQMIRKKKYNICVNNNLAR